MTTPVLSASVGNAFPKRAGNPNAGRTRGANPFDAEVQASYENGTTVDGKYYGQTRTYDAAQLAGIGGAEKAKDMAHSAAQYLQYGLDAAVTEDGSLVIRARDKRARKAKEAA